MRVDRRGKAGTTRKIRWVGTCTRRIHDSPRSTFLTDRRSLKLSDLETVHQPYPCCRGAHPPAHDNVLGWRTDQSD